MSEQIEPVVETQVRPVSWAALAVTLGLVLLLAEAVALYGFQSKAAFIQAAAGYGPYPFATIGWRPLFIKTYRDDVAALEHFYAAQDEGAVVPSQQEIYELARVAVVRRAALYDLARQYGVRVSEKEVDAAYELLVEDGGSAEAVSSQVESLWGWQARDFRNHILRPYALKQKVLEALLKDPVIGRNLSGNDLPALDAYLDRLAQNSVRYWYHFEQ